MSKNVKIAQVGDLAPGEGKVIEVESLSIALFNVDGTFHAMQNACTHVGGPLGEGELQGDNVTCPLHGAQFNVTTGKVLSPPAGSDVKCYAVTIEGDDVLVDLE